MGEIRADDTGLSGTRESKSEITSPAAEIEDHSVVVLENRTKVARGAPAPKAIELQ